MNLSRRLAKLEGKVGPVSATRTYDLRLLHPADVDFLFQFTFRPPGDTSLNDNRAVIEALLSRCEVEPIEGRRVILPKFPYRLEVYWRHQRFVNGGFELPHGNYHFRRLAYAEQAEFQMLCEGYGWDPDAAELEIDRLTMWADEDLLELYDFLEKAVPETEKAIR